MIYRSQLKSFTLVELMVTITLVAVLIVVSLFFIVSVVSWAQNTFDHHTYTVLNDALDRYKPEGGGVTSLTYNATIHRILSQMQTQVSFGGTSHQFLQNGVTYRGRKAALNLRLHDSSMPDHPDSKVNLAIAQVERIWRDSSHNRSTQLVFCDLSVPTGGQGFSVYEEMRAKLIARGVASSEIQFIRDHDSDAATLQLFRDVRAGKVRMLFGSTPKMGTGANVQERLIALHHLDAPWRPADVEQREGRILRQGNTNPEVQIFRYVTEQSFDAYMWQTLETKARFIGQVMTGESDLRRLEDIDGTALTYAEVKAIASGNPLVIEKSRVDAELARLGRLRCEHEETRFKLRSRVRHLTDEIPALERRSGAVRPRRPTGHQRRQLRRYY